MTMVLTSSASSPEEVSSVSIETCLHPPEMKNVTAPYVHSLCEDKSPVLPLRLVFAPPEMKNVTAPYVHSLCEDKSPVFPLRLVFTTLR